MSSSIENADLKSQAADSNQTFRFDGLLDPREADGPRDVVIFDGDCKFCQQQVRNVNRFDDGKRLAFVSLHDEYVAQQFPELTHEMMMKEMYIVSKSGKKFAGASALRFLSRRLPILWVTAPFLHIPFTLPLWNAIYQWIAKRRYKIAGKEGDDCGETCKIHFE